jgi:formamidopyrimidine-DNA glycosylase
MFGWIRVVSDADLTEVYKDLALDVIDPLLTPAYFWTRIHSRSIPIKQLIMDNSIVAGVGNIYACDALNLARIAPGRPGNALTEPESARLLEAMRIVIHSGIELGGATAHGEYVNVVGLAGKYQNVMRVYSRQGEACPNCGGTIEKTRLAGRGTYFCPKCQV